jgi:outer membrane receptor protein involved in Fe transport
MSSAAITAPHLRAANQRHRDHRLGAPGKLTLIPAIRYGSYSTSSSSYPDTNNTAVSPKFAVTYAPLDWFFIFGNVG